MYFEHKYAKQKGRLRFVDFNQGVDARLFNEEIVSLLAQIPVRPLRIAFDDVKTESFYTKALRLSVNYGMKDFSNYLLYNFKDHPIDLYHRMRINVQLCEDLNISIYSFPMKYHPIATNTVTIEIILGNIGIENTYVLCKQSLMQQRGKLAEEFLSLKKRLDVMKRNTWNYL